MTKAERACINAALRWLAADLTETTGNEDNWGEDEIRWEMENAIAAVARERNRDIQSYFDPEPIRKIRRENEAKLAVMRKIPT